MKTKNVLFRILLIIALLPAFSVTYARPDSISGQIKQLLRNLQTDGRTGPTQSQGPVEPARFSVASDGYLRHIGSPPAHYFAASSPVPGKPEQTARNFLQEHGHLFGVTSPAVDFAVMRSRSKNNRHYVRFEQTYAGITVFAAEVIVQVNAAGGVEYVLSDIARDVKLLDTGQVSVEPTISREQAAPIARDVLSQQYPHLQFRTSEALLKIFDPSVLDATGAIRLVWQVRVDCSEGAGIGGEILLDAHSGEIVRNYPLVRTALLRDIFDSGNSAADPGVRVRSDTEPPGPGPSGIADADDAYDFFGDTYNFYWTEHGRDSMNGAGMIISVTVRHCSQDPVICGSPLQCPCHNAYWFDSAVGRLYFGEAMVADDVVGHEYTHGVTDYTSGLVYENESGAIDESFSDTWGEFVDLTNGAGTDTPAVRWLMGEDSWLGDFRDMADPPVRGDPDMMSSPHWYSGSNQSTFVHTNSGVGNKLVYLLTDGDTFNGQTVSGKGITYVADLYYVVQTSLITAGANYADLGSALEQAAVNLAWPVSWRNNLYRGCVAVEIAGDRDVYVAWDSACPSPNGALICPFPTVQEGVTAVFPGDQLFIKAGSYNETIIFDEIMTVNAWTGQVAIIGQ